MTPADDGYSGVNFNRPGVQRLIADAKARRDYYIGLGDDVRYGGRKYDHMKIPSGSSFSVDFRGGLMDGVISFTPVELAFSDTFSVVPSLDLGLAVFGGEWEIDAGEARGTATYQNPPVDFVVGGSSSSLVGAGAPMLGAGLEFRVGRSDWVQWVTRLNAGFFRRISIGIPVCADGKSDRFCAVVVRLEHRVNL